MPRVPSLSVFGRHVMVRALRPADANRVVGSVFRLVDRCMPETVCECERVCVVGGSYLCASRRCHIYRLPIDYPSRYGSAKVSHDLLAGSPEPVSLPSLHVIRPVQRDRSPVDPRRKLRITLPSLEERSVPDRHNPGLRDLPEAE